MPSVPPSSRATSFIAEPIPACSRGSAPMIASVAGVIARPMPRPIVNNAASELHVARPELEAADHQEAGGHRQEAGGDHGLRTEAPRQRKRRLRREDHAGGDGEDAVAGARAASARARICRYVVVRKYTTPISAKNRNVIDDARAAEPRVAEDAHVEHRVIASGAPRRRTRPRSARPRRTPRAITGSPQPRLGRLDERPTRPWRQTGDRQARADEVEPRRRRDRATPGRPRRPLPSSAATTIGKVDEEDRCSTRTARGASHR